MRPKDDCVVGFYCHSGQVVLSSRSSRVRLQYRMGWWHHFSSVSEESRLQPFGPRNRF